MTYIFNYRTKAPQKSQNTIPDTWTENITHVHLIWNETQNGLEYEIRGRRNNHGSNILKPECAQVTLHKGTVKGLYKPSQETLESLASTWGALVCSSSGEPPRSFIENIEAHSQQVPALIIQVNKKNLLAHETEYPYFFNQD